MEKGSFWLPEAASTSAVQADSAWGLVAWVAAFFFALIVGAVVYLVVSNPRRGEADVPAAPGRSTRLTLAWAAVPAVLALGLFSAGFRGFLDQQVAPAGATEIRVSAEKWTWTFTYPNGNVEVNELRVPVGQPVRLVMQSKDVVHSFFVPQFRLKKEVVPGAETTLWFEATKAGTASISCSEYCGTGHSGMLAKLLVLEPKAYQDWLEETGGAKGLTPEQQGAKLSVKFACNTCHSTDGSAMIGPTWKGMAGEKIELADGTVVVADDAFLRESILEPNKTVVKGYQPVMPAFKGLVNQRQLDALVAYMRSVK